MKTNEEVVLIEMFKIIYQGGKGKNHLVLGPSHARLHPRLDYLDDAATRKESGVHEENQFLFPSTRSSLDHASRWHCVKNVTTSAGIGVAVTATSR